MAEVIQRWRSRLWGNIRGRGRGGSIRLRTRRSRKQRAELCRSLKMRYFSINEREFAIHSRLNSRLNSGLNGCEETLFEVRGSRRSWKNRHSSHVGGVGLHDRRRRDGRSRCPRPRGRSRSTSNGGSRRSRYRRRRGHRRTTNHRLFLMWRRSRCPIGGCGGRRFRHRRIADGLNVLEELGGAHVLQERDIVEHR